LGEFPEVRGGSSSPVGHYRGRPTGAHEAAESHASLRCQEPPGRDRNG
jgi:hypothetical protein